MGESMWWLMDIVLPAILVVGLLWLVLQRRSNKTTRKTEQATDAQYDEEERRRRAGTDGL